MSNSPAVGLLLLSKDQVEKAGNQYGAPIEGFRSTIQMEFPIGCLPIDGDCITHNLESTYQKYDQVETD